LEEGTPSERQSVSSWKALRSRTVLMLAAAAFLEYFIGYAVIFWLPTILKSESGISDAQVGLLAALPYVVALIAMLFNAWHSDRSHERRWHAASPLLIPATGFLCLITLPSSTVITVSLLSMICVLMAFLPVFWAIPTEVLSESTAAIAVGMISALASLAGFAGPYAFGYLHAETGSFVPGFALLMCCTVAAAMLLLLIPASAHPRVAKSIGSA